MYEFGYIFRLFRYLKKTEQITQILYDLVAFAFDSYKNIMAYITTEHTT